MVRGQANLHCGEQDGEVDKNDQQPSEVAVDKSLKRLRAGVIASTEVLEVKPGIESVDQVDAGEAELSVLITRGERLLGVEEIWDPVMQDIKPSFPV